MPDRRCPHCGVALPPDALAEKPTGAASMCPVCQKPLPASGEESAAASRPGPLFASGEADTPGPGAPGPVNAATTPSPPEPPEQPAAASAGVVKEPCPNCGEMLYSTEPKCWKCNATIQRGPEPPPVTPPPAEAPVAPTKPAVAGTPAPQPQGAAAPVMPPAGGVPQAGYPAGASPVPRPPAPPGYGAAPPMPEVALGRQASSAEGDRTAMWALICGIVGVVCCPLAAPVGIVLGLKARNMGSSSPMATIGIVLGAVGCLGIIVQIIWFAAIGLPMMRGGGMPGYPVGPGM